MIVCLECFELTPHVRNFISSNGWCALQSVQFGKLDSVKKDAFFPNAEMTKKMDSTIPPKKGHDQKYADTDRAFK